MLLWSDAALLVINKPAGLPTLPDGYHPTAPYLVGILKEAFNSLWVVHRLDRDTSGVIVFARTAEAHKALNTQFDQRQTNKIYHALVNGNPGWQEMTVDLPLRPNGDRKHHTVVDPQQGKPSVTGLRLLERFKHYALIEAAPRTGRTHQIRVHLAAQGHPLIGDALYGDSRGLYLSELKLGYQAGTDAISQGELPILGRLGLHAWSLSLNHPTTGEEMRFEAPYPQDFAVALELLRQYAAC